MKKQYVFAVPILLLIAAFLFRILAQAGIIARSSYLPSDSRLISVNEADAAWSPDSRSIFYVKFPTNQLWEDSINDTVADAIIYKYNIATRKTQAISFPIQMKINAGDKSFRLSPDGNAIICTNGNTLYILNLSSKKVRKVDFKELITDDYCWLTNDYVLAGIISFTSKGVTLGNTYKIDVRSGKYSLLAKGITPHCTNKNETGFYGLVFNEDNRKFSDCFFNLASKKIRPVSSREVHLRAFYEEQSPDKSKRWIHVDAWRDIWSVNPSSLWVTNNAELTEAQ